MLSESLKLFKLIRQKKKCCDYTSWTYFFYSVHIISSKHCSDYTKRFNSECNNNRKRLKLVKNVKPKKSPVCSLVSQTGPRLSQDKVN